MYLLYTTTDKVDYITYLILILIKIIMQEITIVSIWQIFVIEHKQISNPVLTRLKKKQHYIWFVLLGMLFYLDQHIQIMTNIWPVYFG